MCVNARECSVCVSSAEMFQCTRGIQINHAHPPIAITGHTRIEYKMPLAVFWSSLATLVALDMPAVNPEH